MGVVNPMARRAFLGTVVASIIGVITGQEGPLDRQLVDISGLEFVSETALCALHCKHWRQESGECHTERCHQFYSRQLSNTDDNSEDSKVRVLRCGHTISSSSVHFEIDAASPGNIFQEFHHAFFRAFDEMFTRPNASISACELQWLQNQVLPNKTVSSLRTKGVGPYFVTINRTTNQRACVKQIQDIRSENDGSVTSMVSRLGQTPTSATVILVHVNATIVKQLSDLECVDRVVELPTILKVLPFARTAAQITTIPSITPRMWVRVLKGSDPTTVLARLQAKLQAMYGITNMFEAPRRQDLFPRGVFIKPVSQLELWSHALAVAVADDDVEWIDAKGDIKIHHLKGTSYDHVKQRPRRRLDEYVESLVGVEPAQKQGINGDDVIVGITDTGLYIDHDQLDQPSRAIYGMTDMSARKVVQYYPWADHYDQDEKVTCGHGTHVSSLLAGSSFSGTASNIGIASNARIAFMDIANQSHSCAGENNCALNFSMPADVRLLLQNQMRAGAKIFSYSWGSGEGDYTEQAHDLDAFIYANPEILVIVAAGNNGESSVNGQGTISSPSGAKNVISVGASLNAATSFADYPCPHLFTTDAIASFSSVGPTTDGRQKPDVVAPGMALVSARSEKPGSTVKTTQTCSLQGTSQATPVVTGIAVLLYQWLRDGYWKAGTKNVQFGMRTIPAALLKALIIHSGDAMQRRLPPFPSERVSCSQLENRTRLLSYPDVHQGYGKPNLSNIVDFDNINRMLFFLPNSSADSEPKVEEGEEIHISLTVPKDLDLRVTIVWTDHPGTLQAIGQLQHDLDLSLQICNSSKVFYPLTADNTTHRDAVNNVEMVQVSYHELLDALKADNTSTARLGPSGEILVEAIIYGRSVLQDIAQTFAFVASTSVIRKASNIDSSSIGARSPVKSDFWTPGMIGIVVGGAFVLLMIISLSVLCCYRSKRRSLPPQSPNLMKQTLYHLQTSPITDSHSTTVETCHPVITPNDVETNNHVDLNK